MATEKTIPENIVSHTPGPWTAEYSKLDMPGWRVHSVLRQVPPYDAYPALRANLAFSAHETAEADARLIAAAPELLDALKAMVASYDGLRDTLTSPVIIEKLARADAAIAKAEGRA